jgi:O-antigen/teichoic acid export membrane protein
VSALQRNVVYNLIGQGTVLLLAFVAVKFIYGHLGQDMFGIIQFSQVVAVLVTNALELGISSTLVREVSGHHEEDPGYIAQLIRTSSLIYWGAAIVIVVVIYLTAPLLVHYWINLKTADPATAANMIRILGITAAVALPKVLYGSLFRGVQRMELNNGIEVGQSAIQQVGIIVLLSLGITTIGIAWWIAGTAFLSIAVYAFVARRLFGWRALVPAYSHAVVKRNLLFTGHMTSISVLALIQTQADKVIVSKFLPVADLGLYGFASATLGRAAFFYTSVSQAAFPVLAKLYKSGDRAGLLSQYRKLHDLVAYGTLPLFTLIVFAAWPAYTYLFGSSGAQKLLLPTALLALGFYMNAVLTMPYMVSLAVGKPQIASRLNLLALFVVIPVMLVLILWLGLVGAGISWVFYHVFAYAYMVPRVCRECLEIPVQGWYAHFFRCIALGAVTYAPTWFFIAVPTGLSIPGLALAFVVSSIAFLALAYLSIGPELKLTVRGLPAMLTLRTRSS